MGCKRMAIAMALLALIGVGCQSQSPQLRIGVVSDTQSYPGKNENSGQLHLREALERLRDKNIDVLLYAGDIADDGNQKVYFEYREIMDEVFGENPPEEIIVMGNHDYWNNLPPEKAQKQFLEAMRFDSINTHKVVKGYDFIGVSPENGECHGTFGETSKSFLRESIAEAMRRAPEKPFFLVCHQHATGTVYGSDVWANTFFTDELKPYANAVYFSGHSHFPLEDERSIFQQDFTAVGTSSLSYCGVEEDHANGVGGAPPNAEECVQYLYVEVFDDRVDIHRYNLNGNWEIKPENVWRLDLPLSRETFAYTAKRAEDRKAPEFPENATGVAVVDATPFSNVIFTLDAAVHDDFVHTYCISIQTKDENGNWREETEVLLFSDFYRLLSNRSQRPDLVIPGKFFNANTEYKLSAIPMESFGKRGKKAVEAFLTTPEKAPEPQK